MKVTILNGNPNSGSDCFNSYLEQLKYKLESEGHSVTLMNLKSMDLKYCIGCFGCWVKTPGECITHDDGAVLRQEMISSDLMIWASPLRLGYVSNYLKRAMDKTIPLLLPYIDLVHGELHHARRYDRYPLTGLIYELENDTDEKDKQLLENMFSRTSLNFRSRLTFCQDISTPMERMASIITHADENKKPLPLRPAPTVGERISPPFHLTIFNGSPRGRKSNTQILLDKFLDGYKGSTERTYELHDLIQVHQMSQHTEAFSKASCVLLAFPLYTDSMPSNVMAFIETLEQFKGRKGNPAMGFLIQSGFMESAHSRHVEQYLQKFCERIGCIYLGAIVKGGVEGIQVQPEKMTRGLFSQIREIGSVFGKEGVFNADLLSHLSKPEQFSPVVGWIMKLLIKTRLTGFYWDMQLKENKVFEKRYERPYLQ